VTFGVKDVKIASTFAIKCGRLQPVVFLPVVLFLSPVPLHP